MTRLLLVAALFILLAGLPGPVFAAHLTGLELRKACEPGTADRNEARCEAFFHGFLERQQLRPLSEIGTCRPGPLRAADIAQATDIFLYTTPAVGLLTGAPSPSFRDGIPCADGEVTFANDTLSIACGGDREGVCRYFITGVLLRTGIEMRLGGKRLFCAPHAPERYTGEFELLAQPTAVLGGLFETWLRANRDRRGRPAALGVVEALAAAYPCRAEDVKIE